MKKTLLDMNRQETCFHTHLRQKFGRTGCRQRGSGNCEKGMYIAPVKRRYENELEGMQEKQ